MSEDKPDWHPYQPPADNRQASGLILIMTFLSNSLRNLFSSRRSILRRIYEEVLSQQGHVGPMPSTFEEARELCRDKQRLINPEINLDESDREDTKLVTFNRVFAAYTICCIIFIPLLIDIGFLTRSILLGAIDTNVKTLALTLWGVISGWLVMSVFGLIIYAVTATPFAHRLSKTIGLKFLTGPANQEKAKPPDRLPGSAP